MSNHEFAFDVSLSAVLRIHAKSEQDAIEAINSLQEEFYVGKDINYRGPATVLFTAASVNTDAFTPTLFEKDGEYVED